MDAASANAVSLNSASLPLVEALSPRLDPVSAFRKLASRPHCLFLDSALFDSRLGRYSFLTADPLEFVNIRGPETDGLARLERMLSRVENPTLPELPPFQGGVAGLFGYDLSRSLEQIAGPRFDEWSTPTLAAGLYDVVLAYDHQNGNAWLISHGWPQDPAGPQRSRAARRMQQFRDLLQAPVSEPWVRRTAAPHVAAGELAPQFSVSRHTDLTSNFSAAGYRRAIQQAVDYIHAGDVFQVNLSQRLLFPAKDGPEELYLRLRERNSATFAAYFDVGDFQILSASPERFLTVNAGQVESRPIKGTRQRTTLPEADLFAAADLLQSEKDRSENVMIVDLMRNDLSRVCQAGSVQVTQLCELEVYAYVQHLVSAVRGRLSDEVSLLDVIRAAFPAGSITGAPKVRAMQIIAELEPTSRGPYCGSLGYIGCDGSMDLNVLIRTITAGRGWWQLPVGGGIVAQSDPAQEYAETWHKAEGLIRALEP